MLLVGVADDRVLRVPMQSAGLYALMAGPSGSPVELHQLGVVDVRAERFLDGLEISLVPSVVSCTRFASRPRRSSMNFCAYSSRGRRPC